jgi:hypothetical protein
MASEVDAVRRLVAGKRNHGLNRAAFCLSQLVGCRELVANMYQELAAAALSIGFGDREAISAIRCGLRAGEQEPRRAPTASTAGGRANRRAESAEAGGG